MEKDIQAEIRLNRLIKELESLRVLLGVFPDGTLHIVHNGRYSKYYQYFGRNKLKYINKENRQLAVLLWEKALVTDMVAETEKRIENLRGYVSGTEKYSDVKSGRLFACELADEGMMHLATLDEARFMYELDHKALAAWAAAPYIRNSKYQDELIYKSPAGIMVRSKSEKLIATALEKHQIPFRYECKFREYEIFPDFTIKRPMDGEIIIWEHFGIWDKGNYRNDAFRKIDTYSREGFCPDRNLIMTFETREYPFSDAETIVSQYLI